jgi:hypothetical protein
MNAPITYEYMEWCEDTGAYILCHGTIEIDGDRDVPDWVRNSSPDEADAYRPKQMRLL